MASHLTLRTGAKMPAVGFGTWQSTDEELEAALNAALEAGYRHIDTAYVYENEAAVGRVLNKWISSGKVKREDLFIVTKKYLKRSLENLGLDYVDIYLVHVPFAFQERGEEIHPLTEDKKVLLDTTTNHVEIWKEMEKQVDAGLAKAIGLSNFNIAQMERVIKAARIPPANLQVELHVYFQQNELVDFCKKNDIVVCAYSPLGSRGTAKLFKAIGVELVEVAKKHNKTSAQILLRHIIQRGIAAIPKSTNPERILQNFQVLDFELSSDDMAAINKLDQGPEGRILDFGFFKGIKEHPEYPF
ncbi:Alcohol dehydrogenase [NADP(+)] [Blattella germanica]|nr:Alcohol dehydrogenase [NADP(+)] [Blattella germanica]